MITEIFVEGNRLDINADIASLLTFSLDDVKDFAARQTAFSKTIVIPGTANNNALFGNIFETGISNAYDASQNNIGYNFNASKSARCIVFQDNLQTFKGTLRLLQINRDKNTLEYEATLNGELTSLSVALSGSYIDQLDFSAYDHPFTISNIVSSWDNPGGSGYYYPLIDYGTFGVINGNAKHDWDVRTFRPALYVKEYIDKMFAAAKFRYESDLFNTGRFKRLIIPHNSKDFKRPDNFKLNVSTSSLHYRDVDGNVLTMAFPSHAVLSDFTPNGPSTVYVYNGTNPFSGDIVLSMGGTFTKNRNDTFTAKLYINGSPVATQDFGLFQMSSGYSVYLTVTTMLNPGDYLQAFVDYNGGGTWDVTIFGSLTAHSITDNLVDIVLGDNVPMQLMVPKNIKQIDFLISIVKLFNLYIYEDKFDERLIHITPYINFYSNNGDAVDWTYKLNRDQVIKIKPLSEINSKTYNFKYKEDSDYYNDQYKKRYNLSYGSYVYDSQYEFATQTNDLELIFAGTPLVGYAGEDKVYPTIFKRSGDVEEVIDSVIRILQTKKLTVNSWNIKDGITVVSTNTVYGYAGHYDDPHLPDNDLNFGALEEVYYDLPGGTLNRTQFNVYWSAYMAEITDKDSKLVSGRFYLTQRDIFNLDFSKYVILDGVLYRLNKIVDYNVTVPGDCVVELLRAINTSYSFPPINQGGGDYFLLWDDISPLIDYDSQPIQYQ